MAWHSNFPNGFAIVPLSLILDTRLRSKKSMGSLMRVYIAIASHASKDGECRVTEARLSEESGIKGVKEVREFINELADFGYVVAADRKLTHLEGFC